VYVPAAFCEADPATLHALIRANNFGTLVSQVDGELFASHLPFLLDSERGPYGTLIAHLARPNPHWHSFSKLGADPSDPSAAAPALAMFMGSHAYVSPRWYTTELSVPTWNYTAVHAYGVPSIVTNPARVRHILDRTVRSQEEPPPGGWSTERLPDDFVIRMAQGVVAFELEITRLEGKWKLGQNRPSADVDGAAAGLRATGDAAATDVAELMARHSTAPST
jgi:transcriptional regulator